MRIFLTGATGFIGSRVVPELLKTGHGVLGLTRSGKGEQALLQAGAEPYRGDIEDLDGLRAAASQADAVIHTAFDHDFSRFVENCAKDARVIHALGEALAGTGKPLVITSGVGMGTPGPGQVATEDVFAADTLHPRVASEWAGVEASEAGARVVVVRLPQVHDMRRQGLISLYIEIARQKGVVGYVGDGSNRWPAAHVADVARLYRLAVERGEAGERFNAVAEQGVATWNIAKVVGEGLNLPVLSLPLEAAQEHFGWLASFVAMDGPASNARTRERLDWRPEGPSLIADLRRMDYGAGR